MRAKKFGADVSEDKKLARLIKFGAVTDQVWKILILLIKYLYCLFLRYKFKFFN